MTGWQPIETAPKDGTTVICFWPDHGGDSEVGLMGGPVIGAARWMSPSTHLVKHWCYEGRWTVADPTLWQPLPDPPNL